MPAVSTVPDLSRRARVQPSISLLHLITMKGTRHPGAPGRDAMELIAFVMLSALVLNLVKEIVPERW
jgi:hypothetical protein